MPRRGCEKSRRIQIYYVSLFILVAEDNSDDAFFLQRGFRKVSDCTFQIVSDGEQVIQYLLGETPFEGRQAYPFPDWLLLDLKLPRRNGFEVLGWLQGHPDCGVIPTIVYSSSKQNEDIRRAYALGANGYFEKPMNPEGFEKLARLLVDYWTAARRPDIRRQAVCVNSR